MNARRIGALTGLGVLLALPFVTPAYFLHLLIQILLWGFIYTAWSTMGRFGLVSLGHGAFMGVGAYVPALLWNYFDVTPWLGIPLGIVLSALLGLIIGYPCFRLKVVGHYFALVTLALGQVVLLSIVAARDITGGSLGMTPRSIGHSWYALQFPDKIYFYAIAVIVWLLGLIVWRVPESVSGIGVSLQIVFAAIAGGMYAMLGPTVGGLLTIALTEGLRVWFGASFVGAANSIYGILLILFVVFMPRGILGWFEPARGLRKVAMLFLSSRPTPAKAGGAPGPGNH